MEFVPGASAGNVKEPFALLVQANLALFADPSVELMGFFFLRADGRDEKFGLVRVPRVNALEGADQRVAVAGSGALESGNNDDFKAEALGFVDGHQLDAAALADGGIGLREEAIELGIEGGGGGVEAVGRDGIEEGEEDLGVFVSGSVDRGGTAKGAPGALDPGGEGGGFGLAPAEFKGAAENFRGAREALLAVG